MEQATPAIRSGPSDRSWISFVTLGVRDLERTTRFYAETLGLPRLASPPETAVFERGAVRLALYPRHLLAAGAGVAAEGEGFAGFSLSHNVRSREEVDPLLAAAGGGGGHLVRPGHETSWGGYAGWFTDPEGFLWEVVWNPRAISKPALETGPVTP